MGKGQRKKQEVLPGLLAGPLAGAAQSTARFSFLSAVPVQPYISALQDLASPAQAPL